MTFLVTGCGRSGTTWAADAFTEIGLPCEYESQFTYRTHGPLINSESSWLAVPYVNEIPSDVKIVRMIRDPFAVVQSTMRMKFIHRKFHPFERYMHIHNYNVAESDDPLIRAIKWATEWDRPLDDVPHIALFIDGPNSGSNNVSDVITYVTGRPAAELEISSMTAALSNPINPGNGGVSVSIGDILSCYDSGPLVYRARRWGYL